MSCALKVTGSNIFCPVDARATNTSGREKASLNGGGAKSALTNRVGGRSANDVTKVIMLNVAQIIAYRSDGFGIGSFSAVGSGEIKI